MKVALVLLNWNGASFLEKFLPITLAHSKEARIYVIDNGSTDNSLEILKEYPTVTSLALDKNYGFAGGYNKGLNQIEADLYCLLNTDVEVPENWLPPIVELFQSNQEIAILQPHLLDYANQSQFEYAGAAGGYIDALGYAYCRGRIFDTLEEDKGQYDSLTEIFWASGACFFIRKTVFDQLGGFDADFFAHQEEIDLCWRARNQGYKVFSTAASKVFHVGGGTLPPSPFKTFLNYRNSLAMLTKNLPSNKLLPRLFLRLLLDGVSGMRHLSHAEFSSLVAILKAHFHFYKSLPHNLKKRKPANKQHYFSRFSIVYHYFIKKNKKYSELFHEKR